MPFDNLKYIGIITATIFVGRADCNMYTNTTSTKYVIECSVYYFKLSMSKKLIAVVWVLSHDDDVPWCCKLCDLDV